MCGSYTFPRLFGTGKAFELLVLGKQLTGKEAVKFGYALKSYPNKETLYAEG